MGKEGGGEGGKVGGGKEKVEGELWGKGDLLT